MMGDASKFTHISPKKSRHVTYGDKNKGRILGVGKIGTNSSTSIENVLLVEGLKQNLPSVRLSIFSIVLHLGSLN